MNVSDTITSPPVPIPVVSMPRDTVKLSVPQPIHRPDTVRETPARTAPPAYNTQAFQKKPDVSTLGPYFKNFQIHVPKAASVTAQPQSAGVDEAPVAADSVATDSIAGATIHAEQVYGIVLTPGKTTHALPRVKVDMGMSFIYGGLILLFCIIGLRFHNSRKYVVAMLRDLVEVRMRSNVFDETVRETSFLVLLNLMWGCSAGVLLYGLLTYLTMPHADESFGLAALTEMKAASVGICMGVGVLYTCLMSVAYYVVGSVFTDAKHAVMWLKGFTASQGLVSFIYFLLALLLLSWPQFAQPLLYAGAATFILAKIVFIWKGFRIFFSQISSWVLFLYYLCSLEIVPLILTYLAALWLCSLLH